MYWMEKQPTIKYIINMTIIDKYESLYAKAL